ncbi:invasion associated locus B family protein [Rhodoligotrophos defluvii]|uniref:invasion associated locus B family protein n=1 Tax=Rhodoligotrophos defluvii TaxID=2561934 RepID=UPI0010C9C793|nr:invasion associated locus B family protein [Rhodoligotrophos defluvii]
MITSPILDHARRAAGIVATGLALLAAAVPAGAQQAPQTPQFGPRAGGAQAQATQPGQPAQQAGPKPQLVAKHGEWEIQCGDFANPAAAHGGADNAEKKPAQTASSGKSDAAGSTTGAAQVIRQCGMIQVARSTEQQNVGMTLVLVRQPQGDNMITMMRILVPIGVYLPTGVALEIDGNAVGRVPFTQCIPQLCMAFAEATPETLEKLKKGSKANFIIYAAPGMGIGLDISLKGFTAALAELEKQSS